ncbi:MAG: TetR/AcrR family transcriptional regulator [Actinomycetales bacterium]
MHSSSVAKPLRADATRNRLSILEAADTVFAAQGLGASMDDVAAAVGLGVGTIYRRFGSKAALIDALFDQRLEQFEALIRDGALRPTAWEGLCEVMRSFVSIQARNRAVQQLFFTSADDAARLLRNRIEPLLTDLVERAKAEGRLRADFAATDVPILANSISRLAHAASPHGPELARRHLELLLKGLAATPDTVPVPPPLSDDDFGDWIRASADRRHVLNSSVDLAAGPSATNSRSK